MDPAQPPRRRLRLWHLVAGGLLVLVLVLVIVAFAVRSSGKTEMERTIADLTARGYPMTLAILRAGAVETDPLVQGDYDRWRATRSGTDAVFSQVSVEPRFHGWIDRGEPVPQALHDLVAKHAPEFAALRQALRTGRLRAGLVGRWIPMIEKDATDSYPDFANLREAAHFLRASALTGTDPLDFADLVALSDAMLPLRSSIDGMIWIALTTIVDQTLVELEVLGAGGSASDAWARRRPQLLRQHAEALRWELGLAAWFMKEQDRPGTPAPVAPTWSAHLGEVAELPARGRDWVFGESDLSAGFQIHASLAEHLLDPARPLVRSPLQLSASARYLTVYLRSILGVMMAAEAEARSRRVAVLVARAAPSQGLPRDHADLLAREGFAAWVEGGESAYWLVYEALGPTRFRIAIDPRRGVPTILSGLPHAPSGGGEDVQLRRSAFGQAAASVHRLSLTAANTELVVPAPPIAIPAP